MPPVDLPGHRYRILQGQQLHLQYISNNAATLRAWARVRYDNGVDSILYVPDQAMVGDRLQAFLSPSEVAIADGWVTDAVVEMLSTGMERGQAYTTLLLAPESRIFGTVLCSDYCFSLVGRVALGTYTQPGPGGGGGNLRVATIKADGVPVSTAYTLALSNTVRKVYGFSWYYHASATVASRSMDVRFRNLMGAVPTGFGSLDFWSSTGITLTASQDGTVFADSKRSGSNDAGTLVIDNGASNPSPFPLLVPEDYLGTLNFIVGNEEADDFDAIYALVEEWIIP